MKQQTQVSTSSVITLQVSPAQVIRGKGAIAQAGNQMAQLGQRPLLIGGDRAHCPDNRFRKLLTRKPLLHRISD